MDVLKFTLSGKTAFFKKPDVNTFFYFTYGNIHKVALLGLFGAILGYGGYNSNALKKSINKTSKDFPEFYERLNDLKISIVPKVKNGVFNKKIQRFNNSVGYASKEAGGNLIIKEQWLENPSWDIYFIVDNDESKELAKSLLNKESIFMPYLGKNDHIADITNVSLIQDIKVFNQAKQIDSLYPKNLFDIDIDNVEDDEEEEVKELFKYEEYLPKALDNDTQMYVMIPFVFTNMNIKNKKGNIYKVIDKNIVFY